MGTAGARASYFKAIVAVAATLWLMIQARAVLAPVLISVLVWFLLNALARLYTHAAHGAETAANGAKPWAKGLSAVSFVALIAGLSVMTSSSVASFRENLPTYEANLKAMFAKLGALIGMEGPLNFQKLVEGLDLGNLALGLAGTAFGFFTSLIIVLVYVAFIFAEASAYETKLAALAPDPERRSRLAETVSAIVREIETYLGVKCVVGAAQAIPTFIVLYALDVDGAAFWAVLIFVFSFVPTIGSLIGIVFPSAVALAQFPSPTPFFITLALLTVIQLWGSNWLEPKLMGQSLNLSALVILFAIFAGGSVWGITGALIAVPLLSVAVIVFSRIETMRPVAVILSSDGKV